MTDKNPVVRRVGSGSSFTYPITLGSAYRGYKQFVVPGDDYSYKPETQVTIDRKALGGKMWRQTFVGDVASWSFPIIVEEYDPYNHRTWLEDLTKTGMGDVLSFWDHRAEGQSSIGTINGIQYPIFVYVVDIGDFKIRNHDANLYDSSLKLRAAQIDALS